MPLHLHTRLTHSGRPAHTAGGGPVNVPVVRTSTVSFESMAALREQVRRRAAGEPVSTYGRQGMDTQRALEAAMCELEGGSHTFLAPSGLAAISLTLLALLGPGDHLLVVESVYHPVRKLDADYLSRIGVQVSYFDPAQQDVQAQLRPNTRVVYVETLGSLLYEMIDLAPITAACRARGVSVVADNTWGSGYLFNPLRHGADVSLVAGTKYVSGHSDLMMGMAVARDATHADRLRKTWEALGVAVGPDDAYLALRGLRTLAVRLRQHEANATVVARWLAAQPQVERVYYPALESHPGHALWKRDCRGANGLLTVQFRGLDLQQSLDVADRLQLFDIGASWGGYESLVLPVEPHRLAHNGQTLEEAALLRLHIGLEEPQDLIDDLAQAIAATA